MEQGVACTALKLEEIGDEIVFEGEVKYLKYVLRHKRKFILNKKIGTFNLFDDVRNGLPNRFLFNLFLRNRNSHYDFDLVKGRLEQTEGFYSGGYGIKENIRSFRILVDSDFRSGNSLRILKRK
jgi:hypothetical protein